MCGHCVARGLLDVAKSWYSALAACAIMKREPGFMKRSLVLVILVVLVGSVFMSMWFCMEPVRYQRCAGSLFSF